MIRDITIGQYYPARSVLHRLDPRVKLVATLLYLISLYHAGYEADYDVTVDHVVV